MSDSLKQRITTAVLMGIPILILLFYNDVTKLIFVALLSAVLLYELLSVIYQPKDNVIKFIGAYLIAFALFFIAYTKPEHFLIYLGVSLLVNGLLLFDLFAKTKIFLNKFNWITGVFYTALPLSLLFIIKDKEYFAVIIISVLLLSWISDISAYFVGKSIGKHKLMPSVSPGKTWEGFLGAGMIVLICSYFFASFNSLFSFQWWVIIGLTVWLFGVAGDLVESKLKRQLKLKDSGTILPGHGGFLDRFDGFYFCLPFVLFIINYFQ